MRAMLVQPNQLGLGRSVSWHERQVERCKTSNKSRRTPIPGATHAFYFVLSSDSGSEPSDSYPPVSSDSVNIPHSQPRPG